SLPVAPARKLLQNCDGVTHDWKCSSHLVSNGVMVPGLFLLIASLLTSDAVPAPPAIPHEKGSVVVSGGGSAERWTAEWTMEPFSEQGRPAVRFTENGR